MSDITLVNFTVVLALVPICQGIVQMLKVDLMGPFMTRVLALTVGLALTLVVRQAGVPGFSETLSNPYLAILTGVVVALVSSGFYDSQKAGIVKSIAEAGTDITVPTPMVGVDKDAPKATKTQKTTK